jgi:ABC-2 type transport system permease protein
MANGGATRVPLDLGAIVARPPAGDAGGPARVLGQLLAPRLLATRNRYRRLGRPGRVRLAGFLLLALAFGSAIFVFFHRALSYFLSVPEFGPVLTYKLLGMVFVTFFSILLFSNIVTSLSTFFLSRELDRLVAAPIALRQVFYARFAETLIDSSWMMLLFALPAFLAYGVVHATGPAFYLVTALTLPPFLIIPAALGICITTVLVNVFPARRTKDILVLLSVVAVAVLYLLFRLIRPERLVNPEGFADFTVFLGAMRTPEWTFLPSTWAAEILFPLLGLRDGSPLFYYALLASTAAVAVMVSEAVVERLFLRGWTKAQEGRQARLTRRALWERSLTLLTAVFPLQTRVIVVKEIKTFFRDTSQWSQLILLGALVVVYLYNFSVLPLQGSPLVTFYFKNVIAFLNLALAAFVLASVAARFVFPSFSMEGRALWLMKGAPVAARRIWWAKFWVAVLPLLVFGELLVLATNSYLKVLPFMMWLSAGTLFGMVFAIVALALAVGAAYPNLDADNGAKVAASAGGLVYMILCMSFIGAVVVLEAWPVYAIFSSRFTRVPLTAAAQASVAASFAAVVAIIGVVLVVSIRQGIKRLDSIEP